ncbi:hypothetical protein BSL78_29374 [Apostichopus japonicus]|uniref:F-box domain-containing protein n=1 Tax=Stichopus japonicus TaxID=307972 RepID=A0A2G8JDK5_STIJA|nr:hypothetical protein BSL78_29374 [Apostichopus japonicus]
MVVSCLVWYTLFLKRWLTQTPRFSLTGSVSSYEDSSSISVSSLSGLSSSLLEGGTIPSGQCHLDRLSASQRHFILHSVMEFLDIDSKLGCAVVCKEWRSLSRQPSLWRHIILDKRRISSKAITVVSSANLMILIDKSINNSFNLPRELDQFLRTVSSWCLELQTLKLSRIKPQTKRRPGETKEVYQKRTRGILDDGIESLLAASQNNLMIVKITSCQQLLTKKSYLKIAQYCPCLNILKLDDCAIRTEVIRSLAKGCKQLTSLQIVPDAKRDGNKNMTNSNLHFIGSTWYQLKLSLSIGGKNFSKSGLLSVVENCQLLQILELSRAQKVNEDAAKKMCRVGLKELHTFLFTNTIVTPQAILHLYVSCPQLKSIRVYLHLSDVYPGRDNANQYREKFDDAVSELQRLKEHPGLGALLQVRADID